MGTSPALAAIVGTTLLSGVVGLSLAVVASRNRDVPAARPFGWFCLAAGAWALAHAAYLLADDPTVAWSLLAVGLIPSYLIGPLWFVFALSYAGRGDWFDRHRLALLFAPPAAFVAVVLTAPIHGVGEADVAIETVGGVTAPVVRRGVLFGAGSVLSYAYVVGGYVRLGAFAVDSRNVYRKQTLAILLGSLAPLVASVVYTFGVSIHPAVSPAAPAFAVFALVVAWALFRADFLRVTPVANAMLVDEHPEPVLVLDESDCVIDHNPAARRLTGGDEFVGRHLDDVVPDLAAGITIDGTVDVTVPGEERPLVFDPIVTSVDDQFGNSRARLVLLTDVTARSRRLDQLEAMQAASREFIAARSAADIGEVAVGVGRDVLDRPYAGLFVHRPETDELVLRAATDEFSARLDDCPLAVSDDGTVAVPRGTCPLWRAFESGESRVVDADSCFLGRQGEPLGATVELSPLGEHGVLATGIDDRETASDAERQLLAILARTTETALTRIAYESELRENREAVERRNKQLEFFDGVLRHKVRNSMMVIDGHAEFLEGRVDGDADKLATIREWCADLTELTDTIRAVNDTLLQNESGARDRVDLSRVLRRQATALHERREVDVALSVHEGAVVAANDLVTDVVDSVLRNAVEHNDADDPRVEISTRAVEDRLQVRVADNGPGIPEEVRSHVFDSDVTTTQTAHGFGLYFVSVMMGLYDGAVRFEDNDPRGTVVVLEFDLVPDAEVEPVPG